MSNRSMAADWSRGYALRMIVAWGIGLVMGLPVRSPGRSSSANQEQGEQSAKSEKDKTKAGTARVPTEPKQAEAVRQAQPGRLHAGRG